MRTPLLFACAALASCLAAAACSSSNSGGSGNDAGSDGSMNQPDAEPDTGSDSGTEAGSDSSVDSGTDSSTDSGPTDGRAPDAADGGPHDGGPGACGTLCANDAGVFPGAAGTCNGEACAAGCLCTQEANNGRMACLCPGAPGAGASPVCITPNCGAIACEGMCSDDAGTCVHNEGPDASAQDGGPLCDDDAGVFSGASGTCNGATCAPGCACVSEGCGKAACFCGGPNRPEAPSSCIAPTCGSIFCEPGCTCANADAGACSCP